MLEIQTVQKKGHVFFLRKIKKKHKKKAKIRGRGTNTDRKGHGQSPKAGILRFTLATPLCIVGCPKRTKDVAGVGGGERESREYHGYPLHTVHM